MTRIEIDIDGGISKDDPKTFAGKFELRTVREIGENSTDSESIGGKTECLVAKSLETYLKGFLPQFNQMLEAASKSVLESLKNDDANAEKK